MSTEGSPFQFNCTLSAMCVSPAVVPSGSEGSEGSRPTARPSRFLEAVINFRCGGLLEECLLDTELVRLALTCRFALATKTCWLRNDEYRLAGMVLLRYCLCEKWYWHLLLNRSCLNLCSLVEFNCDLGCMLFHQSRLRKCRSLCGNVVILLFWQVVPRGVVVQISMEF